MSSAAATPPAAPAPPAANLAAWRRMAARGLIVLLAVALAGTNLLPTSQSFVYNLWGSWHDNGRLAPEAVYNQRLENILRPLLATYFPTGPANLHVRFSGFSPVVTGDQSSAAAFYFKATQMFLPARVYTGTPGASLTSGSDILQAQAFVPVPDYLHEHHIQGVLEVSKQADGQVHFQYRPVEDAP